MTHIFFLLQLTGIFVLYVSIMHMYIHNVYPTLLHIIIQLTYCDYNVIQGIQLTIFQSYFNIE